MIYYGYGVMGAAKTLNALKICYDYETKNKPFILLSNTNCVESRIGLTHDAIQYNNITPQFLDDMFKTIKCMAVIIDEVQFCPMDLLIFIIDNISKKCPVFCYGLYMNSNGTHPFEQSQYVYQKADIKQEFYSVCDYCNQLACRHVALDDDNRIILNAKDITRPKSAYKSVCNECFQRLPKIDYGEIEN